MERSHPRTAHAGSDFTSGGIRIFDNSCIHEPDCAGICGGNAVEDCAGICGGHTIIDECGICGGDGPEIECWNGELILVCHESDCMDEPENSPFNFNQSSTHTFYHILSAFNLAFLGAYANKDFEISENLYIWPDGYFFKRISRLDIQKYPGRNLLNNLKKTKYKNNML